MKMKRTLSIILLSLIAGLGVRDVHTQTPTVTAPCRIGQQAPAIGFWTWAANAHVRVYIASADFKTEEIPYLLKAFQNWNSASELTGSGVTFEYVGDAKHELSCDNCLTVMRGPVFNIRITHATHPKNLLAHRLEKPYTLVDAHSSFHNTR